MALQKTLTTPYDVSGTVYYQVLDSLAINVEDELVHIGFSILDVNRAIIQRDMPITLAGQEYSDFMSRVNTIAANPSYSATQAIQAACLENVPGAGTISVI